MDSNLSPELKLKLKGKTHSLKPVVMISATGLSDSVLAEVFTQLKCHELIKIKVKAGDRTRRKKIIAQILEKTGAHLILAIGNVVTIYQENSKNSKKNQ